MHIILENGTHSLDNLGDLAMLQVAYQRLHNLWPEAVISVVSYEFDELKQHLKGVEAIRPPLWWWRRKMSALGLHPQSGVLKRALNLTIPRLLRHPLPPPLNSSALLNEADMVVMSGSGILADPFITPALLRLNTLENAQQREIPTALMSQGLGPMHSKYLHRKAGSVLKQAKVIGLREGLKAPALLDEFGVPETNIFITGDDSLAVANRVISSQDQRGLLGLNLRIAPYSNITLNNRSFLASLESRIAQFLRTKNTSMAPIAIHRQDHQKLNLAMKNLREHVSVKLHNHNLAEALATINLCKLVVAGSYHAAVFALAQGIPTICLSGSQYYRWKFEGLAEQFPQGCVVIELRQESCMDQLSDQLDRVWSQSESLHPAILQRGADQVASSASAYQRLREYVPSN